jgi:hypothetical protein
VSSIVTTTGPCTNGPTKPQLLGPLSQNVRKWRIFFAETRIRRDYPIKVRLCSEFPTAYTTQRSSPFAQGPLEVWAQRGHVLLSRCGRPLQRVASVTQAGPNASGGCFRSRDNLVRGTLCPSSVLAPPACQQPSTGKENDRTLSRGPKNSAS